MLINLIVISLVITSIGGARDLILANDTEQALVCTHEDVCPKDTAVKTAIGYGILIVVKTVNIDGSNGDFLLIKSGTQIDDGLNGIIFTYNINRERKYITLFNEILIRLHVNEMDYQNSTHIGLHLTVQRFDLKNDEDVSDYPHIESVFPSITVNMTILGSLAESLYIFRGIVAIMGQIYVDNTNFTLTKDISENDVKLIRHILCPIHWPHRNITDEETNLTRICFQITFSLPISLSEDHDSYGSYQLNEYHLRRMWENASYFFNEKDTPGIAIYTQHYYQFVPWKITIFVVLLIFAISYLVIGCVFSKITNKARMTERKEQEKRRDGEENIEYVFDNNQEKDIYNMDPFQRVPPVTYFDPDRPTLSVPRRSTVQQHSMDESILNANNINFFNPRTHT